MFAIPATGMLHLTNESNLFIMTTFRGERLQVEVLYGVNNIVLGVLCVSSVRWNFINISLLS
jgi:hypothetical protein